MLIVLMMHQRRRRASLLSPIPDPTVRPDILPRRVHPPARPRRSIRAATDDALHRSTRVRE